MGQQADPVGQRQFIHTVFRVAALVVRLEALVPVPLYLQPEPDLLGAW